MNRFLYYLFYVLFSTDTWRICIGFLLAVLIGPMLTASAGYSTAAETLIRLMLLAIGYALSAPIARRISRELKKRLTG
ncbi:MAG: hypothetical protein JRH15_12850 [Deltaproteobacteria bacterium]|nr:hypothetical protein [Deltaproteobacteria bacterium]